MTRDREAVRLDFARGGSMPIFLPKPGDAASVLHETTRARLDTILSRMDERPGLLRLPRFKAENRALPILETLQTLGAPLFDAERPAIRLLSGADPQFVSQVSQTAIMRVDEDGTTTAEATFVD